MVLSMRRVSGAQGSAQTAKGENMKRRTKYTKDMPRLLYTSFISHSDKRTAPSFSKFARSIGATLSEVEGFRENEEFERAYRECNEIRRDYLIDQALTKQFDPSLVKFLLTAEFGMGEKEERCDTGLDVTLTVISDTDGEA
jgi:hypothetical protein